MRSLGPADEVRGKDSSTREILAGSVLTAFVIAGLLVARLSEYQAGKPDASRGAPNPNVSELQKSQAKPSPFQAERFTPLASDFALMFKSPAGPGLPANAPPNPALPSTLARNEISPRDLPIDEAPLVSPVLVPTRAPDVIQQARSLPILRRPLLRPATEARKEEPHRGAAPRRPIDNSAAEQTASIGSLPKRPHAGIDVTAAVRTLSHPVRSNARPAPPASRTPAAPWKLPAVIAPSD